MQLLVMAASFTLIVASITLVVAASAAGDPQWLPNTLPTTGTVAALLATVTWDQHGTLAAVVAGGIALLAMNSGGYVAEQRQEKKQHALVR